MDQEDRTTDGRMLLAGFALGTGLGVYGGFFGVGAMALALCMGALGAAVVGVGQLLARLDLRRLARMLTEQDQGEPWMRT